MLGYIGYSNKAYEGGMSGGLVGGATAYRGYPLYEIPEETASQLGRRSLNVSFGSNSFPTHDSSRSTILSVSSIPTYNAANYTQYIPYESSLSIPSATKAQRELSDTSFESASSTASSRSNAPLRAKTSRVSERSERDSRPLPTETITDKYLLLLKILSIIAILVFPMLGIAAFWYWRKAKNEYNMAVNLDEAVRHAKLCSRLIAVSYVCVVMLIVIAIVSVHHAPNGPRTQQNRDIITPSSIP